MSEDAFFKVLLLVITITGVYVIGDKFSSVTITKDKNTQVSVSNQDAYDIKPVSELNLTETDTGIGKAGKSLKDGYEELAGCKNKKDFDTAMKSFAQLVSSLKNEMKEELAQRTMIQKNTIIIVRQCCLVLKNWRIVLVGKMRKTMKLFLKKLER